MKLSSRRTLTLLALVAAAFAFTCCKAAAEKDNGGTAASDAGADTAVPGEVDMAADEDGFPRAACLVASLNVRATPGTGGSVVGALARGEEAVVLDEDPAWFAESAGGTPVDGYGWFKVRLAGGATGYVAAPFVAPVEEYEALAAVDAAARSGDAAATERAIAVYYKKLYGDEGGDPKRDADGRKFLVSYPNPSAPLRPVYLVELGSGICGRIIATGWECSADGSYVAATLGDCVGKRLSVYEWSNARLAWDGSVWRSRYEFLPAANVLVWVEGLHRHPEPYELAVGIRVDPATLTPFGREAHPCVFAHDFDVPTTFLVAGPDPNTLHKLPEGGAEFITLRPEAVFTSHPLFPAVAATETYREWVGAEVYAYCSEE